jgi:plasmid rolling circle replication initiator protein Rep
MASPLQLEAGKLPPVPRAGFAAGDEAEGGRAAARYVHKIGTSSNVLVWRGLSVEGAEIKRRKKRDELTERVVGSLNRCGREKQAKALATCGEFFDVWVRPGGEAKLLPCPCDSMFCPECANRRSRPLIQKLSKMVNRPGRSYWFLTLTVPNVENLSRQDISEISEQFAELWNSWVFQECEDADRKAFKIYGGVRSIECVYEPESKSWHPHIHVLFEGPRRLPWWWLTLLKVAWNRITGGARYLYLERAYTVTKRGKKKFNVLNTKALREVCKYVTKCAEFAGDHLLVDEFLRAFKGVRRIQCFGSFHGAAMSEFEREPGEDSAEDLAGEATLADDGYRRLPFRAHIGDTEMRRDGSRQLTLAFMERVRAYIQSTDPPLELEAETVVTSEQKRIEFAGALPEKSERQSSLFESAA